MEQALRRLQAVSVVDPDIAISSAVHCRTLRRLGISVRKTINMLIGTFCIEHDHALLHSYRDFDHLERHLRLLFVRPYTRVA